MHFTSTGLSQAAVLGFEERAARASQIQLTAGRKGAGKVGDGD